MQVLDWALLGRLSLADDVSKVLQWINVPRSIRLKALAQTHTVIPTGTVAGDHLSEG